MDKRTGKFSLSGIFIFTSLSLLISSTVLLYGELQKQTDKISKSIEEFHIESRIQSDNMSEDLLDLTYSIEDFRESFKSFSELHSERLGVLNSSILDKNQSTNRAIRDSARMINQSFLEFLNARNSEVNSDTDPYRDNLENELVLERAFHEGRNLYKEKSFAESRDLFFDALTIYPHDREIRFYYLSSLYLAEPSNISNYKYLKDQLRLFTYDKTYSEKSLNILAEISLAENDMENAHSLFCTLHEDYETNLLYTRSKGLIEYQMGLYGESLESFSSYLHSYPLDYEIIYFYGLSLYQLEYYKEALDQFYKVEECDELYGNLNRKIDETLEKLENS